MEEGCLAFSIFEKRFAKGAGTIDLLSSWQPTVRRGASFSASARHTRGAQDLDCAKRGIKACFLQARRSKTRIFPYKPWHAGIDRHPAKLALLPLASLTRVKVSFEISIGRQMCNDERYRRSLAHAPSLIAV